MAEDPIATLKPRLPVDDPEARWWETTGVAASKAGYAITRCPDDGHGLFSHEYRPMDGKEVRFLACGSDTCGWSVNVRLVRRLFPEFGKCDKCGHKTLAVYSSDSDGVVLKCAGLSLRTRYSHQAGGVRYIAGLSGSGRICGRMYRVSWKDLGPGQKAKVKAFLDQDSADGPPLIPLEDTTSYQDGNEETDEHNNVSGSDITNEVTHKVTHKKRRGAPPGEWGAAGHPSHKRNETKLLVFSALWRLLHAGEGVFLMVGDTWGLEAVKEKDVGWVLRESLLAALQGQVTPGGVDSFLSRAVRYRYLQRARVEGEVGARAVYRLTAKGNLWLARHMKGGTDGK